MQISPGAINDMLVSSIESFVKDIFPAGRKIGNEWCVGGTDGGAGESLRL
jgi:hypothetical protein